MLVANQTDPAAALRIVQEHKDLEPELRYSMIDAISKGRVDVADDTSTMLAFQDRMFGGEAQVASNDFAKEISKGNLRIETSKELLTMQHHMNKGEKKLVNNALSVLDASFHGVEDFAENPSRLAARNFYLRSLTKAIRENDMQQLITLTNKEHVQAVGNSFSGGSLGMAPPSNTQVAPQKQTPFEKFHGMIQRTLGLNLSKSSADVGKASMGIHGSHLPPAPLGSHYSKSDKVTGVPTGADEGIILMERAVSGSDVAYNAGIKYCATNSFFH